MMAIDVANDIFTEADDNSMHLPRGDIILLPPSDERRKKQRGQLLKDSGESGGDIINQCWSLEEDATTATKIETFLEIMVYII